MRVLALLLLVNLAAAHALIKRRRSAPLRSILRRDIPTSQCNLTADPPDFSCNGDRFNSCCSVQSLCVFDPRSPQLYLCTEPQDTDNPQCPSDHQQCSQGFGNPWCCPPGFKCLEPLEERACVVDCNTDRGEHQCGDHCCGANERCGDPEIEEPNCVVTTTSSSTTTTTSTTTTSTTTTSSTSVGTIVETTSSTARSATSKPTASPAVATLATNATPTTLTITTTVPVSSGTFTSFTVMTGTTVVTPSPSPAPNVRQGQVNNTVSNSDPRIQYAPPDAWQPGTLATCSGAEKVRTATQVGATLQFSFTGTAIYLSTASAPNGGMYQVTLDDDKSKAASVDGFSTTNLLCTFAYIQTGLANQQHTLKLEVTGPSPRSPSQSTAINFDSITFTSQATDDDTGAAVAHRVDVMAWRSLLAAALFVAFLRMVLF